MTTLAYETYLDHLAAQSRRFRDVLAGTDPDVRVPSCPDWSAADLLWHLAGVQHFWGSAVLGRPAEPREDGTPARPDAHADVLELFDAWSARLVESLRSVSVDEPVWTWAPEKTAGFVARRQAHEALIHRLDAELAAGAVTPLPRDLAADGVAELLGVMYAGCPPWGTFTGGPDYVRVDVTDTGDRVWVRPGRFTGTAPDGTTYDEDDIAVVEDPGAEPAVTIAGTADDLDAWLWHRRDGVGIDVRGDDQVRRTFLQVLQSPVL